jgi:hypothetical protein
MVDPVKVPDAAPQEPSGKIGKIGAEEEAEGRGGGLTALSVGLRHRQLVQVGE